MAYCQSLVKLKKDSHWVSVSWRVLPSCLFFSCFKSCSIYPHLLHIIALSDMVCWPGCVSKRDNASQQGFADGNQKVFLGKVCRGAGTTETRQLLSVLWGVGSSLMLFSHPWGGGGCCYPYQTQLPPGWV